MRILMYDPLILISIPGQAVGLCTFARIAEKAWKRKLPADRAMLLSKPQGHREFCTYNLYRNRERLDG